MPYVFKQFKQKPAKVQTDEPVQLPTDVRGGPDVIDGGAQVGHVDPQFDGSVDNVADGQSADRLPRKRGRPRKDRSDNISLGGNLHGPDNGGRYGSERH